MTDQLLLVFDGTTASRFEEFHRQNGHVYRTLVRLAREWVNRTGQQKLGMKSLYERARWDLAIETSDPEFQLNNSYTAYYARLIQALEPDLADLFETRASAADQWIGHYLTARAS